MEKPQHSVAPQATATDSAQPSEQYPAPSSNPRDEGLNSDHASDQVKYENENNLVRTKTEDLPLNKQPIGKRAIVMLALMLAVFLAALDVTIVTTALETIVTDLKSPSGYSWIGSAFTLASSASTPLWGKISDIFGRKPLLVAANVIFMIGSLIAALSVSMGMLIAARVIQGIGAGGLLTLVNICISDLFELQVRGIYYGLVGAVWAFASSIGPMVGGAFAQKVSWRWCFYINLPIDGLALVIIVFFLKIKTPKTPVWEGLKAIDWLGAITVVGATLMLLFGLEYGGINYPWDSATVICLIVFGIVTFALFFLIQAKVAVYPIMPLGIFANRSNALALAIVFLHGMVFISSTYYLPLFYQVSLGATPILAGVYLLPFSIALAVGAVASGIIMKKTGAFVPLIIACTALLTLGYGLYTDLYRNSGWAKIIIYQIIAGLGVGPLFQAPLIAVQAHTPLRDIATVTMTVGFVRNLAVSVGIVIANVVWQNEFKKRNGEIASLLGAGPAARLSGNKIAAQADYVKSLPRNQRLAIQSWFGEAIHPIWIMMVCFAAVAFILAFFVKPKTLQREHTKVEQGLDVERARAAERKAEKAQKRASRLERKAGTAGPAPAPEDVEKSAPAA